MKINLERQAGFGGYTRVVRSLELQVDRCGGKPVAQSCVTATPPELAQH